MDDRTAADIPDLPTLDIPIGGRVMVLSDLHLGRNPSPAQAAAIDKVAQVIESWTGPGALIVAGGLFGRSCGDPAAVLGAHPRLTAAIGAFAVGAARRVLVLPGAPDALLGWAAQAQQVVTAQLGATLALAVELTVHTGAGVRQVRVEPGQRLDPLAACGDPRNPGESPLAQHLVEQVMPAVRARQGGRRGGGDAWLSGMESLADPATFPRFLASRLAYRKLGRHAWLVLIPVVIALILRLPSLALQHAHGLAHPASLRVAALVGSTVIELAALAALAAVAIRRTWRALAGLAVGEEHRDPNEAVRGYARDLITAGGAGLVTGHSCAPELSSLGGGFYANAGCVSDVVGEVDARLPGLGLPSVFLAHRQVAWVELEAGGELHVRLFHARQDLPGATVVERLVARRRPSDTATKELRPAVVASFPQGQTWPPVDSPDRGRRRVRRLAASFVAVAGFVSLVSTFSEPVRDRLHAIRQVVPIAVPETAAALVALGAVGLLVLARGIRRGQRRAWFVTEVVLLVVAVLHLVKGVAVEEAAVSLAVAGFLWVNRRSFEAATDTPPFRRGLLVVLGATGLTVAAGTLGLELGTWITQVRHHPGARLSWWSALQAASERMVGVEHVFLPPRVNAFFTPAMSTATVGLALALLVLVFRPVVRRRRGGASAGRWSRLAAASGSEGGIERARGVVARHGAGTLDYFALRPDKEFFFWGDTVVAYAVYGGVCLVSPDPIGPESEREPAWRAFRAYVDERGWALGGLGAGESWLPIYRSSGMHDLYVGDEAVVRVGRFSLEGGRFKGLRQAVNRVAKYGYTISFHDPSRLDPALRDALREVMTKSRRGDVERGFSMTLGRVFDPADEHLLLAVVHGQPGADGAPGAPVAFCQYVPAPGIGGYSLDLMRRDDGEHPNGLIDFAVVETIRELARRGDQGLGLNFATMRAVLAGETGEGMSQRVQAWFLRRMGGSMQIESLWKFNAKFDPDWQPRYAVYDAPENALAVAVALARAESWWELPIIGRFLVPNAPGPAPASPPGPVGPAAAPAGPAAASPRGPAPASPPGPAGPAAAPAGPAAASPRGPAG
ncbi:MAG: phosphatidylglycerol lysyltransferase domain-containing protein, partial [Acidimicrobiales bacterium]